MLTVLAFGALLACAGAVYFDARGLGARRGVLGGGFLDHGAVGWFCAILLAWIVAFPAYLVARARLVRRLERERAEFLGPDGWYGTGRPPTNERTNTAVLILGAISVACVVMTSIAIADHTLHPVPVLEANTVAPHSRPIWAHGIRGRKPRGDSARRRPDGRWVERSRSGHFTAVFRHRPLTRVAGPAGVLGITIHTAVDARSQAMVASSHLERRLPRRRLHEFFRGELRGIVSSSVLALEHVGPVRVLHRPAWRATYRSPGGRQFTSVLVMPRPRWAFLLLARSGRPFRTLVAGFHPRFG